MRFERSVLVNPALTFALLAPLIIIGSPATAQTLKVPDGTILRLALLDSLSSATNQVDDPVHFEVTEDVKVGDTVVLPKGTTAQGHVVEVEPKKRLGRSGKLNFSLDYARAPDGTNIRLRASSARKGEDKSGTVIVGTVLLSPLFLIMRGKDVTIPKGTTINAYVDGDREISLGPQTGPQGQTAGPAAPSSPTPVPPQPTAQPPVPASVASEALATVVLKSDPDGADITVDGKFIGSTPSTVRLLAGDHTILIEKSGRKSWQRTVTVTKGGIVTVDATLDPQ
jgi:PEGA domain